MRFVLDSLLAPIARLAVARGVLFGEVAERLKVQFLRGAIDALGGQRVTDSRLSVMTGLQRRDVQRLRGLPDDAPPAVNHLARLVALWQVDPRYAGRALARRGADSFEELAAEIRRDVHARTMLEQLLAAQTVMIDADDCVVLRSATYQPLAGSDAQLAYLARNGGDFLSAATDNVMATPAPHFERAVHYNGLSAAAVAELDAMFRDKQLAVLKEVNARAAALQAASPGAQRFRSGAYFYSEEEE